MVGTLHVVGFFRGHESYRNEEKDLLLSLAGQINAMFRSY